MSLLRIGSVLLVAAASLAGASDPECRTAADAASWAQELTPEMAKDKDKLRQVLDLLRIGTERCRSNPSVAADAWYYRALLQPLVMNSSDDRQKAIQNLWIDRAAKAGSPAAKEVRPLFGFRRQESKPVTGPVREKFALVVGISKFKNDGISKLHYTAKDAEDFANVLKDPKVGRFKPDNVTVLLDEHATLFEIRTALGKIRSAAQPDDLVLLYFSSHGSPRESDPRGVSYVVAYDTDVSTSDRLYGSGLAMSEIINTLNRDVQAQRLVLFLDTCFSGAATGGDGSRSLVPVTPAGGTALSGALAQFSASGWAVIAASRSDQRSWESDQLHQGYFTYYLMDTLRKTNGMAPLQDVFQQLRDQVSARVKHDISSEQKTIEQTPVMSSGSDGAKLVLGVEPQTRVAAAR